MHFACRIKEGKQLKAKYLYPSENGLYYHFRRRFANIREELLDQENSGDSGRVRTRAGAGEKSKLGEPANTRV